MINLLRYKTSKSNDFEYGFWFWSNKLDGVLAMLAYFADYKLDVIEIEFIRQSLIGTNDELDCWTDYCFNGRQYRIDLMFSYDGEEHEDMIHIRIKTNNELKEKIKLMNLFQSMFKDLILEK